MYLSKDKEKELATWISGGGESRSQKRASAKPLRWEHAWCVQGAQGGQHGWRRGSKGRGVGDWSHRHYRVEWEMIVPGLICHCEDFGFYSEEMRSAGF